MKHLFASGEILYKKNIKNLNEGNFIAEHLDYDNVSEDATYKAIGNLNNKPAVVEFKVKGECYDEIGFRFMAKILMQSDLFAADWEYYKIVEL
jgi:hypothetical protein